MKPIKKEKVIEVLNHIEDIIVVNDDSSIIGIDSITFIQMIVSLEEEFNCEIPDSKLLISEMDTVNKIINVLQTLYNIDK